MSRYAYLTCPETKRMICLGSAVFGGGDRVLRFSATREGENWSNEILSRALWKFIAESVGHSLVVRFDYELDDADGPYTLIGGDSRDDISFSRYLDESSHSPTE